jgi:hypothetical protein
LGDEVLRLATPAVICTVGFSHSEEPEPSREGADD